MTPGIVGGMAGKGTKRRTIRIDDELWDAVVERSSTDGTNPSEICRTALEDYVSDNGAEFGEALRQARAEGYAKGVADAQGIYLRAGLPGFSKIGERPVSPFRKDSRRSRHRTRKI